MFLPSPAHGLVVFHCLVASSAALAQSTPGLPIPAVPTGLDYRSAFEHYVPFSDGPPTSWREANDTVGRRGGWKAHAEEAARPASAPSPPAHGHGHAHPTAAPGPASAKERP